MKTLTPIEEEQQQYQESPQHSHAALIHLSSLVNYLGVPFGSVVGPLITWAIWRDEGKFTDENGKEALNFNLSIMLYQVLAVIIGLFLFLSPILATASSGTDNPIGLILSIPGLGLFIGGIGFISIFRLIAVIVAAVKAGNGEIFHYPLSIRFIK